MAKQPSEIGWLQAPERTPLRSAPFARLRVGRSITTLGVHPCRRDQTQICAPPTLTPHATDAAHATMLMHVCMCMGRTSSCRVVGHIDERTLGSLVGSDAGRADGGALERGQGNLVQQTRHGEDGRREGG